MTWHVKVQVGSGVAWSARSTWDQLALPTDVDQESVNALLRAYTVSAIEEEGNEKPLVASGTQADPNRIWTA
jgi:hypothetical protein